MCRRISVLTLRRLSRVGVGAVKLFAGDKVKPRKSDEPKVRRPVNRKCCCLDCIYRCADQCGQQVAGHAPVNVCVCSGQRLHISLCGHCIFSQTPAVCSQRGIVLPPKALNESDKHKGLCSQMVNSYCWHSLTFNFKCPMLCLLTGGGLQLHGDEGGGGRYPSVFRASLFSSINQSTTKSCEGDDGAGSVMVLPVSTGQRKCKKKKRKSPG